MRSHLFRWAFAFLIAGFGFSANTVNAQNQPFWSNSGNSISTGDFLGSTNNQSLIFKTNNVERGRFDANGNFIVTGNTTTNKLYVGRIISTDSIIRFGDSTITMDNNNNRISWSAMETVKGLAIGNNRPTAYGLNSLALGYGVSTASEADNAVIIGSAASGEEFSNGISNSLMVGFNSTIPTFYVGSGTGANTLGNVGIGTTEPAANFEVNGTTKFSGPLTVGNSLNFGTSYGMKFMPASGTTPATLAFGPYSGDVSGPGDPPAVPFCTASPASTVNAFSGLIQSYGYATVGNQPNALDMGFNGTNGIIELLGSNPEGVNPVLNINTDCGKDVNICNQTAGYVHAGKYLEVGTVPRSTTASLNVAGTLTKAIVVSKSNYEPFQVFSDGATKINVDSLTTTVNAFEVYDRTNQKSNFIVKSTGNVFCRRLEVTMNNFPDYVFDGSYKLLSFEQLSDYIKVNKHLPGMPTAEQIEKEGADLGELTRKNVEKIEELTLYIIELNKQLQELRTQVNEKQ